MECCLPQPIDSARKISRARTRNPFTLPLLKCMLPFIPDLSASTYLVFCCLPLPNTCLMNFGEHNQEGRFSITEPALEWSGCLPEKPMDPPDLLHRMESYRKILQSPFWIRQIAANLLSEHFLVSHPIPPYCSWKAQLLWLVWDRQNGLLWLIHYSQTP